MKTKLYTHKRKSGRYRVYAVAKGSGTLNTTGNDELVVYHNEMGQYFVRPLVEFTEIMNEVRPAPAIDRGDGNWPESAEKRSAQLMQNGNDGEPYQSREAEK